jgi:hypothetical protein
VQAALAEGKIPSFAEYLNVGRTCSLFGDNWKICILSMEPTRNILDCIFLFFNNSYPASLTGFKETVQGSTTDIANVKIFI